MKYALSSRQTDEYLKLADEIRVQYRDREIIHDFIDKYPDKTIILEIPFFVEENKIDFQEIETFNKLLKHFICRISRPSDITKFKKLGIQWYYGMIVDKWEDLAALSYNNPCYVLIGGDLFFNLPRVKDFNIPVRAVPNVSTLSPLMPEDGMEYDISIVGDWFQPEAIEIYEPYISVIEFEDCTLQQERALFRIYSKDGWPGKIKDIISNIKSEASGRLINPEWFYKNRLDCGRKCIALNNRGCQLCYRQFILSDYEKLKQYKEEVLDEDNNILESEGAD